MDFVDTHCHPQFDNFLPDPDQVIKSAAAAGVSKLIAVGTTLGDSQKAIDIAAKHKFVWASAGSHPHEAADFIANEKSDARLEHLLKQPKIVAIGEIGLDYYKNYSSIDNQKQAFKRQFELGLKTGLPFIFHVREAFEDFWSIFDAYNSASQPILGVIHSFSASVKELDQVLERGLFVGLNGIMTFTKDQSQLEAARLVPKEKLLLETDAPFLSPKPFRGQACQPKFVIETARFLSELRAEPLDELADYSTANAVKLFGLR